MVMIPVSRATQLMPGRREFAIHELLQRRIATSIFDPMYPKDETGGAAYDPQLLLQVVLFADSRGILSSRKIEQACREHITFMAWAGGMVPDHSTIAAFISSMKDEIQAIFSAIRLLCAEQDRLGGTHVSLDGFKLSANASKEWSGTFADLRQKQAKVVEQVKRLLEPQEIADKAGAASSAVERLAEQAKGHEQSKHRERQASRLEALWAANPPKQGKRGKERQRNLTANASATMQPGHGVIQGYQGQALVDATPQVILHAEACGHGQDSGHGAPMGEGAQANLKASGLAEKYFEGNILSAASHYQSEETLKECAHAQLEAYLPDPHFRQRAPRFDPRERHQRPIAEQLSFAEFPDDKAHDCSTCPQGKGLTLEARRHKIGNHLSRSDEADEAAGGACLRRAQGLHAGETRRKQLAVWGETVQETVSPQMIAKIDTPAARKIDGLRRAIVDPVCGNIRSQKRLDRFTWRGKITVNLQGMLYCMVHHLEKIVNYGLAV